MDLDKKSKNSGNLRHKVKGSILDELGKQHDNSRSISGTLTDSFRSMKFFNSSNNIDEKEDDDEESSGTSDSIEESEGTESSDSSTTRVERHDAAAKHHNDTRQNYNRQQPAEEVRTELSRNSDSGSNNSARRLKVGASSILEEPLNYKNNNNNNNYCINNNYYSPHVDSRRVSFDENADTSWGNESGQFNYRRPNVRSNILEENTSSVRRPPEIRSEINYRRDVNQNIIKPRATRSAVEFNNNSHSHYQSENCYNDSNTSNTSNYQTRQKSLLSSSFSSYSNVNKKNSLHSESPLPGSSSRAWSDVIYRGPGAKTEVSFRSEPGLAGRRPTVKASARVPMPFELQESNNYHYYNETKHKPKVSVDAMIDVNDLVRPRRKVAASAQINPEMENFSDEDDDNDNEEGSEDTEKGEKQIGKVNSDDEISALSSDPKVRGKLIDLKSSNANLLTRNADLEAKILEQSETIQKLHSLEFVANAQKQQLEYLEKVEELVQDLSVKIASQEAEIAGLRGELVKTGSESKKIEQPSNSILYNPRLLPINSLPRIIYDRVSDDVTILFSVVMSLIYTIYLFPLVVIAKAVKEFVDRSRAKIQEITGETSKDTTVSIVDLESHPSENEPVNSLPSAEEEHIPSDQIAHKRDPSREVNHRASLVASRISAIIDPNVLGSWLSAVGNFDPPRRKTRKTATVVDYSSVRRGINTIGRKRGNDISNFAKDGEGQDLESAFKKFMDDLGIPIAKRKEMMELPDDNKRMILLQNKQNQAFKTNSQSEQKLVNEYNDLDDSGITDSRNMISQNIVDIKPDPEPKPSKRFSLTSWTSLEISATSSSSVTTEETIQSPTSGYAGILNWFGYHASPQKSQDDPEFYVEKLTQKNISPKSLSDHLLKLRVTLSTAKLSWIKVFLEHKGLTALETALEKITINARKNAKHSDHDDLIQLECIRCLRVLMNTEPGFGKVLESTSLISNIVFCLNTRNNRLRAQVADILAALCVLSLEGHKHVLGALSDFRIIYEEKEKYRFEYLIATLKGNDTEDSSSIEYKAACLSLVNAIVNSPEEVDQRVLLREEFERRGIEEVFATIKTSNPPDWLMTQIKVYEEEYQEDLDELSEKVQDIIKDTSDPRTRILDLLRQVEYNEGLFLRIIEILKKLIKVASKHSKDQNIFTLIEEFIDNIQNVTDIKEDWQSTMNSFNSCIQDIVGNRYIIVK
ncbi:12498_t:CDS:10, partial [Ambispora leptoticha]